MLIIYVVPTYLYGLEKKASSLCYGIEKRVGCSLVLFQGKNTAPQRYTVIEGFDPGT